jgi:hypothetical protein
LIPEGPIVGSTVPKSKPEGEQAQELRLRLDRFAWQAIGEESHRLGVPVEELARFSVLYYLADLDSGRIARRIPPPSRSRA